MKRSLLSLLAVSAIALSGVFAGRASADTSYVRINEVPRPTGIGQFDAVIDEAASADLVAITERLDAHLSLDANGLVRLDDDVTAAEIGVDETFLSNYRKALAFSNVLIERGELTVDADMTVHAGENFAVQPDNGAVPGPVPGASLMGDASTVAVPDAAVPQWGAYGYGSGAMFYNSYNTFYQYRFNYYGLSSAMAAYLGYPHISPSINYFYTYNNQYLSNSCYNPYGVYYFLPYQSTCQYYNSGIRSYQPCYGNLGYKPAYYWQQTNTYSASCRCYQSNWQWQGYWSRY